MRKVRVLLVPAIAVGCLIVAGCGGDGSRSSSTDNATPPTTKTVVKMDPKKEWVRVESDRDGLYIEMKCIGDDLMYRTPVYGGYNITVHPNFNDCMSS